MKQAASPNDSLRGWVALSRHVHERMSSPAAAQIGKKNVDLPGEVGGVGGDRGIENEDVALKELSRELQTSDSIPPYPDSVFSLMPDSTEHGHGFIEALSLISR